MPLVGTNLAAEPRAFSVGPAKLQIMTIVANSGDTTGTVTADSLSTIEGVIVTGVDLTAAPTISGNSVSLAFVNPAADRHGQIIFIGT